MKRFLFCLVGVSVLGLMSVAQDVAGSGSAMSANSRQEIRVDVQTITLSTPAGKATAHVYTPQTNRQLAGVVFSHSQVKGPDSVADLLPLAMRVAKSGAAVIVVDRALLWPVEDADVNRGGGGLTIAALHWLLTHANIDSTRCAYVGPKFKDPANSDALRTLGYQDGIQPSPWVPLGESQNEGNMSKLDKPEGQMRVEHFLHRQLGLGDVAEGGS
ncbi:MAG: hypothetical protein WB729_09005 [Candidatus Sulfotelmatobacter sp.]